jgi:hypothetical protein
MAGAHRILIATMFVVGGSASSGSQQPLKEAARAQGGVANQMIFLDFSVMDLHDLVAHADVVVHARVVEQRVTLNRDETIVMTEYTLAPLRIPIARSGVALGKPGQIPIIVRRPGGKLTIDGMTLSTEVDAYPTDAALATGEAALFSWPRQR